MTKFTLYIGANNQTKEVDKELLINEVSKWFKGFTVSDSIGLWEGT
jgi:hypothetical protein